MKKKKLAERELCFDWLKKKYHKDVSHLVAKCSRCLLLSLRPPHTASLAPIQSFLLIHSNVHCRRPHPYHYGGAYWSRCLKEGEDGDEGEEAGNPSANMARRRRLNNRGQTGWGASVCPMHPLHSPTLPQLNKNRRGSSECSGAVCRNGAS